MIALCSHESRYVYVDEWRCRRCDEVVSAPWSVLDGVQLTLPDELMPRPVGQMFP